MQVRAMVYFLLQLPILVLHALVQYTITKARLTNKQYYLIRILSIFDSLFAVNTLAISVVLMMEEIDGDIVVFLYLGGFLWTSLSLHVTTMVVVDRTVAVKYCLRYHQLVSKRKINFAVAWIGFITALVLSCLFYIGGVKNIASDSILISSRDITIYITIVRSFVIIVLGKINLHIRNRSEAALQRRETSNLHGVRAERLDIFRTLKRSIKDVIQLNFWTCMFVFPMAVSSLLMVFGNQSVLVFRVNAFATSIYTLSNPIIYLTCFTPLRQFWRRRLRCNSRRIQIPAYPP